MILVQLKFVSNNSKTISETMDPPTHAGTGVCSELPSIAGLVDFQPDSPTYHGEVADLPEADVYIFGLYFAD